MATYERDVREYLKEHGCYFVRHGGRGDHDIWYSPITKRNFTVDGAIKSRHTANAVLK
ncbi:MAG: type II toxin-antitoxin system HicA family toxin, partial [Hyphomicrobiaceae bacterium]